MSNNKVIVHFRAAGGAPILANDKVKVAANSKFSKVVAFLRTQLQTSTVFVYLREAFCPALDDEIQHLVQAYGIDGKLQVSYALTPAWG